MYSIENNISHWDIVLTGIVFFMYIVGKVWMYYKTPDDKGTKRGSEWD